jgi:hypothetical protein
LEGIRELRTGFVSGTSYGAVRNKPVRFHMLHKKDSSRIKEVFYCRKEV